MKNLKDFILEASKSPFDEIIGFAEEWFDYMYNEGVEEYNDEVLKKIMDHKAKPDYKDVCKGILDTMKGVGKKTIEMLENYIKDGKGNQVENAINIAVKNYCNKYNIG